MAAPIASPLLSDTMLERFRERAPKIVHAFMPRASEGYSIKETWDVLGMRATASQDTALQGAFVPDRYVARVVPAGFAGADLFILAIFAWALTGFANVYSGSAAACSTSPSTTSRPRPRSPSPAAR